MNVFKIINLKNHNRTIFGFGSVFFKILRNTKKDHYAYYFYDFVHDSNRLLHQGVKIKILTPFLITVWCVVFNILVFPISVTTYVPIRYFNGAKNFIKDSAWYQDVRFFSWVNFILLICALIFILLR